MNKDLRFQDALRSLPRPGGNGYHPRLLGVANIGIRVGISPADVATAIRTHTPQGGRRVSEREIEQAVTKALHDAPGHYPMRRWHNPHPAVRPFDAATFMAARLAEAAGIGEADVWAASPIRVDWPPEQDAVELLARLYAAEDILFVGNRYDVQVRPVADWLEKFHSGAPIPPYVLPNSLTGETAPTKDGKPSYRSDACVKSFRFAVAEFDGLSREDQLRFWWAVNLPLCALIDSGNKSLHAWIRIDGIQAAEQWTRLVEDQLYGRYLVPLGCDAACRNEARLSRMPGHFRAEKGRWQRVLYLAPEGRRIKI